MPDIIRKEVGVKEIIPNPDNPNEMTKKELELLVESIKEIGFIDPPQVVEVETDKEGRSYFIVGGEHRWRAAIAAGLTTIPVDVLQGEDWSNQDIIDFVTVRMNVLHGKTNPEKFLKLYKRTVEKYGKEVVAKYMGFTSEDGIKKLIGVMAKSMKETLPPEMAEEFAKEAKDAKTVADLNNIIQRLFNEYGDTIKHNFMIFSWAGKEHIYLAMNKETHDAMKVIMKEAKKQELDINNILGNAIKEIAESIKAENE